MIIIIRLQSILSVPSSFLCTIYTLSYSISPTDQLINNYYHYFQMREVKHKGFHDVPELTQQVSDGAGFQLRSVRHHHLTLKYKSMVRLQI